MDSTNRSAPNSKDTKDTLMYGHYARTNHVALVSNLALHVGLPSRDAWGTSNSKILYSHSATENVNVHLAQGLQQGGNVPNTSVGLSKDGGYNQKSQIYVIWMWKMIINYKTMELGGSRFSDIST